MSQSHISHKSSTKRKSNSISVTDSSPKKSKNHKHKEKHKGKGKSKAAAADHSEFSIIHTSLTLSIPPIFAEHPQTGALELIDSMLMRYIPALEGVVLAHSNLKFLDHVARIVADSPYLLCDVSFDATVWGPRIGMSLEGRINLCSPDHISLLLHETFNASIPRRHIPSDLWHFQYGPAANDPEYGAPDSEELGDTIEDAGRWVHSETGETLGGPSKRLKFVVIGLTVANEMLSILGSIQPDPFSPTHLLEQASPQRHAATAPTTDEEQFDDDVMQPLQHPDTEDSEDNGIIHGEPEEYPSPPPPEQHEHEPAKSVKKRKRHSEGETNEKKKKKKKSHKEKRT